MKKLILIALMSYLCSAYAAEKTPEQVKADDDVCKADIQCFSSQNIVSASVYCKGAIEKLGKYSHRWTDNILQFKFTKSNWLDKKKATLSFFGDRIEFQNGFGAYQNHIYQCDFDPASKSVLAVKAQPGRF